MKRFLYAACMLLFVALFCQDNHKFVHAGVDEGLSQGSVFGLAQDNQGFLWVGTADGLNRFDGYNFKVYTTDLTDSLAMHHPHIRCICNGRNAIWVTTSSTMELYRVDLLTQKIHLVYTCPDTATYREMAPFKEDSNGVWLITSTRGVISYDWEHQKITQSFPEVTGAFPSSNAVSFDSVTSTLWYVAMNGVLCSFNTNTHSFQHHPYLDSTSSPDPGLTTVSVGQNGNIWLGGVNCLLQYIPATGAFTKYVPPADSIAQGHMIASMQSDSTHVWCGTERGKVYCLDLITHGFSEEYNPVAEGSLAHRVTMFLIDHTKNIWIGTDPDGLYKIDTKRKAFHHTCHIASKANSLKNNFTKCFFEKDRELYVGLYNNSISIWNRNTGMYRNIGGFADAPNALPTVSCIAEDSSGMMWVTTSQGIGILDSGSATLRRPDVVPFNANARANGNTLLLLDNKTILVGIDTGIYQLKAEGPAWKLTSYHVKGNVDRIFLDRDNHLWAASLLGIYYSPNRDPANFRLIIGDVGRGKTIIQTSDGTIWAGTETGLLKIDPQSQRVLKHYGLGDGLLNTFIYGIVPDANGDLWVSTNKGLSRFDPVNEIFRNYTVSDGLQSNEFNTGAYYANSSGELFFGGVNGFNYFRPDEIADNPYTPQCAVTGFSVFDKPLATDTAIEYRRHITLGYEQNNILIEYTALEFSDPLKNNFRYRMRGIDTNWTDAGKERFARFVNLDPGEYTFELVAANNDGKWNSIPMQLFITITPPFWKTIPFIAGVSLAALLSLVIGIRFYFRRQLKRRTTELQREQSVRMNAMFEAEEKERKRIAGELHDGLGQLLSTARLNVAGFGENINPDDEVLFRNSLQLIDQACEEIRTISHNMMPGALIRMGLVAAVNELVIRINDTEKLHIEYEADVAGRFDEATEIALYRVIQEALNNMVRHSGATSIHLSIFRKHDDLLIMVSDNGKGFDVSRIPASRGLGWKNMYARIDTLNGTMRVESDPGKGTRIFITVPLKKR